MKGSFCLTTAALVAVLILVPTPVGQEQTTLPASGSVEIGTAAVLLPAAALLVGGGVLGYAILRHR